MSKRKHNLGDLVYGIYEYKMKRVDSLGKIRQISRDSNSKLQYHIEWCNEKFGNLPYSSYQVDNFKRNLSEFLESNNGE
mgnify:CR=1 FL=1